MDRMRRMLFALLFAGMGGTLTELLLTGHTEEFWQWVPVALLGAAMPAVALTAVRPAGWAVAVTRTLMVLCMAAGALGTFFHYESNSEFAVELSPGLSGFALLSAALTRPTPPPLAPGTMIMLGALGLICCTKNTEYRTQNTE